MNDELGTGETREIAIARVFPRRTKATPSDRLVYTGGPDLFAKEDRIDEVHVSVTFTWDIERGRRLADAWDAAFPGRVKIGGPAFEQPPGDHPRKKRNYER